jgi:hypothetical protein
VVDTAVDAGEQGAENVQPNETASCRHCKRNNLDISNFDIRRAGIRYKTCNQCRSGPVPNIPLQEDEGEGARRPNPSASVPMARRWLSGTPLPARHQLSELIYECTDCKALHFWEERLASSRNGVPKFSKCCQGGKVQLKDFKDPPEGLWHLFTSQDAGMDSSIILKSLPLSDVIVQLQRHLD